MQENQAASGHTDQIAPKARIRRDWANLARWRGECDATLERLLRFCELRSEAKARASIESMLPGFSARLAASPYYRETLEKAGLSPSDLCTVTDIASFPTLDRATLGERWRDVPVLADDDPRTSDGALIMSSGSTGAPIRVFRDGYEMLHMWAMLRFWCASLHIGLPEGARVALVDALPGGLEYESEVPVLPGGGVLRRISTRLDSPYARLVEFAPHAIFSDPAGLHWLMSQVAVHRPLITLSSAQYLPPGLKAECESGLGASVVDYYSISESGPIAWACPSDPRAFHVLGPDMWVESIGGELAVTKLRPSALPLLRYLTGDRGDVSFCCGCGFRGWVITGFCGRSACEFVTPSGALTDAWQLAWVFKHHALNDFYLEQTGPESFGLELLGMDPGGEACANLVSMLAKALRATGFCSPNIEARAANGTARRGPKPAPFGRRSF